MRLLAGAGNHLRSRNDHARTRTVALGRHGRLGPIGPTPTIAGWWPVDAARGNGRCLPADLRRALGGRPRRNARAITRTRRLGRTIRRALRDALGHGPLRETIRWADGRGRGRWHPLGSRLHLLGTGRLLDGVWPRLSLDTLHLVCAVGAVSVFRRSFR
jgi:hypothetical protein